MDNIFNTGIKGTKQQVLNDGAYYISFKTTESKCLCIDDDILNGNFFLNIQKLTKNGNQCFFIKYDETKNSYTIMCLYSHQYLGVRIKSNSNYLLTFLPNNSTSNDFSAEWDINKINDTYFSLKPKKADLFLEYNNRTDSPQLNVKNDTENQKITIKSFPIINNGFYSIISKFHQNFAISFPNANNSILSQNEEAENQLFWVQFDVNDGCYSIINVENNYSLSFSESKVTQKSYSNLDSQKWILSSLNDQKNDFYIELKSNLLQLDSYKNNDDDFVSLKLSPYDSKNQSLFHFKPIKFKDEKKSEEFELLIKNADEKKYRKIITLNSNIIEIDYNMFKNYSDVETLELPLSISKIHEESFKNCKKIKTIKCDPKWLKLLPNPLNIENIIVQQGVEQIDENSFKDFINLKFLSLPQSLKLIHSKAFNNLYDIKTYEGDPKFLIYTHKTSLINIVIPEYVTDIPEKAFCGCKYLKKVVFSGHSKLKTIQSYSFAYCESLKPFQIPKSVNFISSDAFYGINENNWPILTNEKQKLSMIDNLVIDENVTKITEEYEDYCNIESLEIPLSVDECESKVLQSFNKLKYVKCNPKFLNYFQTSNIVIVFIPAGIKQLKRNDFENLVNLKFIEIPESVVEIEENTFINCPNLTDVKCGTKHLKFLNQNQLKILILNKEVKKINRGDFDGLINLENCELPEKIQINDKNLFINCKKLTKVNNSTAAKLINNKISINKGTKLIHKQQFEEWFNLKFLEIPETVENIEEGTFDDCTNINHLICDLKWFHLIKKDSIRKLTIPDFVPELLQGQFDDFYSLTQIELPSKIKINNPLIFDSCESLSVINCNPSLFITLSCKTRNRCFNNKKDDVIYPFYNFQNDEQHSFENSQETSIDDLVKFDKNNEKYCHSVMNVRGFTYSGKIEKNYKPENSSLSEISKVCGEICYVIHKNYNIFPKTAQYLAVLRLADVILNNNGEFRGEIGKIAAGEGKTLIITILSIILAKYDRVVDVVVSNFELAKRQQKEQESFYKLFGIETGVLNDNNEQISNEKLFKCPVVYSTIENFESAYLHSIMNMKLRERKFDVVLIDEIDKMLIDDFPFSSAITNEINFFNSKDVYEIVYLLNNWKTTEIIKVLNYFIPNSGNFEEENIQDLKNAALEVIQMTNKIDYLIENGQIICMNSKSHFNENVYHMIEIKENLRIKPSSYSVFQINHHSYLNMYNKIAGVTGSIGNKEDEELIKKGYNVNIFKVLPHVISQTKIITKSRPSKMSALFECIFEEIIQEREKGRPILVIWDSIDHLDEFMKSKSFLLAQRITGKNPELDNFAIENAGTSKAVTIATFDASIGIDIKVSQEVLNNGGLHVIVPLKLKNQRSIENAAGRSGRQGQIGSVTFYTSKNDTFIKSKEFSKSNKYLTKIEQNFASYIQSNFPWILSASNHKYFAKNSFPFDANISTLLNVLTRHILLIIKSDKSKKFEDLILEMIHLTWSVFLTSLLKKTDFDDKNSFEIQYNDFLKDLNVWLHPEKCKTVNETIEFIQSKLKNELDFDCVIFDGIKISESDIIPIFPEKSLQTKFLNGISLPQGEEVYIQLQNGEEINWSQILSQFCNNQLISIIDEKWMSKTKNIDIEDHDISAINEEEDEDDEEIFTVKCQQQQDTWEWIFFNIKNNNKKIKTDNKPTEIPSFLTLEFIELALNLSGDAYSGTFSFGKVIYSSEENEMFKPVFYCLEESNNLYVITRGSFSTNDWMTDFNCREIKFDVNEKTIYFHQGFYNSAQYILNAISSFLEKNYENIFFIGHSYGASVSAVLCLLTKSQEKLKEKNIYAMAFGSAPSMSFCPPEIENCIFTFINNDDLIPTFSLFNTLNTAAKNHLSFQVFVKLCLLILKSFDNSWIKELVYAIEQNFEIITDIIGILNVKKVKGTVFKIGVDKNKKLVDCIIDDSKLPSTLSISLTSLFNHFINEYEKSLKNIQS